ncbi:unnamed protein product [Microthlaspi erraticum]|uniref:Uncharacterized protein n=1 Tax=Microthlaspi erraticum TaxID=1685480 RepID=A0A6D2JQU3_9BRAS|nr:unnamed protein product [Microthlaspi erraticum]
MLKKKWIKFLQDTWILQSKPFHRPACSTPLFLQDKKVSYKPFVTYLLMKKPFYSQTEGISRKDEKRVEEVFEALDKTKQEFESPASGY